MPMPRELQDELVEIVIDQVLARLRRLRRLSEEIREAQTALRASVSAESWNAYLRVEELVSKRNSKQLRLLFKSLVNAFVARRL